MVVSQPLLSAAGSVVLVAGLLGGGAPDPSRLEGAERALAGRSATALAQLGLLAAALEYALDELRAGAALLVQGDGRPSERLERAADQVEASRPAAAETLDAVMALEGALSLLHAEPIALHRPPGTADLRDVAAGLRALAEPADAFFGMRVRTSTLLERVGEAVGAIDGGRHEAARDALRAARAEHEAITGWEIGSGALAIWLETTDGMIGAVETLNGATEGGDEGEISAARDQLARISADARTADRALSVAVAEGASRLAAPAVERMAGLLETVERARASVVDVRANR